MKRFLYNWWWVFLPLALLLACHLLAGCVTHHFMPHGIPNLSTVGCGIYRGGQPSPEGWRWLAQHGVTNVVKLNEDHEGKDDGAAAVGMKVQHFPITVKQMFGIGTPWNAMIAANSITAGTYVHCTFGCDRTGTAVAIYRLHHGWTKTEAQEEMLLHGFNKGCCGLWDFWQHHVP